MKSANEATGRDYRQRICRAMNFISANLGRDPSLEEIAAAANFSPYHFHRIFTAATFMRMVSYRNAACALHA